MKNETQKSTSPRRQDIYRAAQPSAENTTRPAAYQDEEDFGEVKAATYSRRRWKKYRWVAWLLVMIPIIYMAVQVFVLLTPRMRTETAIASAMTDAITAPGFVVMSSTPIAGTGGILYYTAPTGQRVSAGSEVALVFATEDAAAAQAELDSVNQELVLLADAQGTVAEGGDVELLKKQLHSGVYDLLGEMEGGDYSGIATPCDEITLASNKIQIAVGDAVDFESRIAMLNEQKTSLEAVAVPTGSITAEQTGYFVPSGKSDRVMSAYDTVAEYTPAQLQTALEAEADYYGAEVVGHIVTDYKWRYFAMVPARDADKFTVGAKLDIAFADLGEETFPVTVQAVTVDEGLGAAKVELLCEYINPELLELRNESAQIIFSTQKGLRISKDALRLVDVADEDGTMTTYKGVYVKFGNMVYFRKVEILLEDEHYMLVSATYQSGVNEVEMYDDVVVDAGGVELYDKKIL